RHRDCIKMQAFPRCRIDRQSIKLHTALHFDRIITNATGTGLYANIFKGNGIALCAASHDERSEVAVRVAVTKVVAQVNRHHAAAKGKALLVCHPLQWRELPPCHACSVKAYTG